MISLIIGIVLVLFSIGSVIVCVMRTPDNLAGWYGIMFAICALGGLLGGVYLILCGISSFF